MRIRCVVAVLLVVAAAASGARAQEEAGDTEDRDSLIKRSFVVDVLVSDMRSVLAEGEHAETVFEWDGTPAHRYEIEVKDRYETLFQELAWRQLSLGGGGAALYDHDAGDSLLAALRQRYRNAKIATHGGWKSRISSQISKYPISWDEVTGALRREHMYLMSHRNDYQHPPAASHPALALDVLSDAADPTERFRPLLNASHLPTMNDVITAFEWLHPTYVPFPLDAAALRAPVLSAALPSLIRPAEWTYMFSNHGFRQCEIMTAEYIDALAAYLHAQLGALETATVLEVGAGNGRLTHFVGEAFRRSSTKDVTFVATDAYGRVADESGAFPVERMSAEEAVEAYKPQIILCSWMSIADDWTPAFRAPSVQEYILIGEVDYGVSGRAWNTWGVADSAPTPGQVPPFESDGFERVDLHDISWLQIARSDSPFVRFHSRTTAFRRRS